MLPHLVTPQNSINIGTNSTSRLNETYTHRGTPVVETFVEQLRARDGAVSMHILDELELGALVVTLQLRALAIVRAARRRLAC